MICVILKLWLHCFFNDDIPQGKFCGFSVWGGGGDGGWEDGDGGWGSGGGEWGEKELQTLKDI